MQAVGEKRVDVGGGREKGPHTGVENEVYWGPSKEKRWLMEGGRRYCRKKGCSLHRRKHSAKPDAQNAGKGQGGRKGVKFN